MIHKPDQDRVSHSIAWLLLGIAGGLSLDLLAKELLRTYSLQQFILLRSLIALLILVAIASRFGGLASLRTRHPWWHLLRTILGIGAMFGFFYGLSEMPLVNAFTLGYTAPLMVAALAALFLDEPVGWRRWTAVVVGFAGVLVMLRPGSGEMSFAAAAVLLAAFCYACQAITARKLSTTESTLSLSFYVIIGPMLVSVVILDGDSWRNPDAMGWGLLVGAGASSVLAWIGLVNGYRSASPALLAPLEYLALVGGAVAGYLFWGEVPDRWVVAGAMIIMASGLFVIYRSNESAAALDEDLEFAGGEQQAAVAALNRERTPTD
jgi:drug/metabolite transporter (DMT)-like permease